MKDDIFVSRRSLLATGVALSTTLAGCSGNGNSESTEPPESTPGEAATQEPTPEETATSAAPVFNSEDPGRHSYPRNPSSAEEEIVGSKQLARHIIEQISSRRMQNNVSELYTHATLLSNTRTHSWDMYNRSYFDTTSPDGVTPVDRYNGMAIECTKVEEYIFQEYYIVEDADGNAKQIDSEQIAADIFSQMLDNETMRAQMLTEDYNSVGAGTYFVPEESDSGETRLNVHVTVDYCQQ